MLVAEYVTAWAEEGWDQIPTEIPRTRSGYCVGLGRMVALLLRRIFLLSSLITDFAGVCSVIVIFSRYCRYCVLGLEMVLINRLMAAQIQREGEECPCSE